MNRSKEPANSKRSLRLSDSVYTEIEALAAKRHIKPSALMRDLIERGLSIEKTKEDMDFIRMQIRQEIQEVMEPYLNRMIKLEIKIGTMSVVSAMAGARLLSKVNFKTGQTYHEVLEDVKKEAAAYLRVKEERMDYSLHRMTTPHGDYEDLEG